ncbi:MAG: hypothetical protein MZW92_01615, partial [Comamonadaceae bacterium]|nr:hypothetical protein [Comamonadaceae bacterium]
MNRNAEGDLVQIVTHRHADGTNSHILQTYDSTGVLKRMEVATSFRERGVEVLESCVPVTRLTLAIRN